jgi:hypothetical protein
VQSKHVSLSWLPGNSILIYCIIWPIVRIGIPQAIIRSAVGYVSRCCIYGCTIACFGTAAIIITSCRNKH